MTLTPGDMVQRREIATVDWAALFAMYSTAAVGKLVIDTEGHDCQLVLGFPFARVRPNVIAFEAHACDLRDDGGALANGSHAPALPSTRQRTHAILEAHGYRQIEHGSSESGAADAVYALVP